MLINRGPGNEPCGLIGIVRGRDSRRQSAWHFNTSNMKRATSKNKGRVDGEEKGRRREGTQGKGERAERLTMEMETRVLERGNNRREKA